MFNPPPPYHQYCWNTTAEPAELICNIENLRYRIVLVLCLSTSIESRFRALSARKLQVHRSYDIIAYTGNHETNGGHTR